MSPFKKNGGNRGVTSQLKCFVIFFLQVGVAPEQRTWKLFIEVINVQVSDVKSQCY